MMEKTHVEKLRKSEKVTYMNQLGSINNNMHNSFLSEMLIYKNVDIVRHHFYTPLARIK